MPLSEHEQRMLQEMERALYAEDPRFASNLRNTSISSLKSAKTGLLALLTVAGIIAIGAGVALAQPIFGIIGFVAALGGLYGIVTAALAAASEGPVMTSGPSAAKRRTSMKDRAEERFRQRRDENGQG
ncbi:MAG: hypothetical protein RLZZ426_681 [Actinomycetota bacterium]|jgi:hypothetical protein